MGGRRGFFVCGEKPLWLLACRGWLYPHPHDSQGSIMAFTPFDNQNCPRVRAPPSLPSPPLTISIGAGEIMCGPGVHSRVVEARIPLPYGDF